MMIAAHSNPPGQTDTSDLLAVENGEATPAAHARRRATSYTPGAPAYSPRSGAAAPAGARRVASTTPWASSRLRLPHG
jgi:hypothetical protein